MSIKVKLESNAQIFWMNKCVHCGCPSDRRDTVSKARYKGTGFYVIFATYSQQIFRISYPVCLKHKIFAKSCRFIYWSLLMPVIVLGLTVLFSFSDTNTPTIKVTIAFLVVLIIFVLSIILQLLRIIEANDNEIILSFKNEKIAKEFLLHN